MSQKPQFANLPTELLLHIAGFLSSHDLNSFSRLSRQFHWRLFHLLFDSAIAKRSDSGRPEQCLVYLFFHAVKHDSKNIAQYLIYSTERINLNGPIQTCRLGSTEQRIEHNAAREGTFLSRSLLSCLPPDFTFLHFALLADAPRVAADLIKNGADISQEVGDYPDLTPLYLTLPRSLASSPKELDSALRIACSYALPRTTGFLLARGANANTTNKYGIAAIHTAVMRRRPWREFPIVDHLLFLQYREGISRWKSMLLQTVSTLLDFGADIGLQSRTSRTHKCEPKYWRSIDCDHHGQTALHIASASGILAIVSCLLNAGADPNLPDGQGYTALYGALVQGHKDIACRILKRCDDPINPIVYKREQTTALHVACRFSFSEMVSELLRSGANANVIDSHGRTPLHNVLAWAPLDRGVAVVQTRNLLAKYDADPDITTHSQTPRELAETHTSMRVRDVFLTTQKGTGVHRARSNLSSHKLNVPDGIRNDVHCSAAQCRLSGSVKSSHEAGAAKLPQDPFPDLAHPAKDRAETTITAPTRPMNPMLEKSVWAPHKTAQLAKGLVAGTRNSDQDDAKVMVRQPFPEFIIKASGSATHTAASVAGVWSGTETAQLIKGLETLASPSKRAPQSQDSAEAFPELSKPAGISAKAVVQGMLNAEATQFWASLTKQSASAVEETAMDSSENTEELRAEMVGTKTRCDRNRRRWTPLRF